jgi:uncharacterized membrane protein YczE
MIYLLGNFILALGIAFTVKSDLGLSPINTLPYVVSKASGIGLGSMVTVIYSSLVFIQILILFKRFRVINLLQIVISVIFGYFVSLSEAVLSSASPVNYAVRLIFFAVGLLLIGFGIMLYLASDIMPQPPEGLMLTVQQKSGWKFSNIKIGFDCVMLALAVITALLTGTGLSGIREGTVVSALVLGKIIALLSKHFQKHVTRFCFGPSEANRVLE